MNRIDTEIKKLKNLLDLERKEEYALYDEFIKASSLEERRRRGLCWQPLKIIDQGHGLGDYPYIVVERTKFTHVPHQFSAGKMVSLYPVDSTIESWTLTGTIHWADKNSIKIILNTDDFPDWVLRSSLGVNFLFDEKSYKEMDRALEQLLREENKRPRELFDKSRGNGELLFEKTISFNIPNLNGAQNEALNRVMAARDMAIIHGPPGTGKTTTLVETIIQLVKNEKQILVCAPSNTACDLLAEKLSRKGLETLRMGNLSRIDPEILELTLEKKVSNHEQAKEIKKLKRKIRELRSSAGKYKRNFGQAERTERRSLYREAKDMAREATTLENYVIRDLLDRSQVICTTLVGARHRYLEERHFKTVVIDEAAQALEPACWIPILKSDKVVLAGDPFQLPPTVKSLQAQKEGLPITLMEKSIQCQPDVSFLNTQYRMNTQIMDFSNRQFYKGQLIAHKSVAQHTLTPKDTYSTAPLEFIDTAGTGYQEETPPGSSSFENKGEQELIEQHLGFLLNDSNFDTNTTIGIISPYKAQVIALQTYFNGKIPPGCNISINTVDAFQGQERDVIYISLVRSNNDGNIGFLSDLRRMNVAMTRAKKKLVILGDSATLTRDKFYLDFFNYAEETGAYKSAFELMY